jgi:predicted nucleic acid-binding protein
MVSSRDVYSFGLKKRRFNRDNARCWDANVILSFLSGRDDCTMDIVNHAESGNLIIVTSSLAEVEVAYVDGIPEDLQAIETFFAQPYVRVAPVDKRIRNEARDLVRRYRISGNDAIYVATAIVYGITIFETKDEKIRQRVTDQRLIVRAPACPDTVASRPRLPGFDEAL